MKLICLLILFLSTLLPAHAQTGNGTIRGIVEDTAGATVPGATVTITHLGTNLTRTVQTNDEGLYSFAEISIGPYQMEIAKEGFKKISNRTDLQVGQTAVVDLTLEAGDINDVVTITDSNVITTETTEIADVKDAVRIRQLPLNGREISRLFSLTPGVEAGDSSAINSGGSPRVNGLKVGSAEILLDGVSIVNRFGGGLRAQVQPGLDTIQEFRIETSGSSAQYDRPATVILSTKSGTNDFHGSLFETHRNNAAGLLARRRNDFFETAPKLIRNEYGFSVGGPVFLPKFGEGGPGFYNGRNRTFWFFAYEGLKQRQSVTSEGWVPTQKMRNGDFSEATDPGTGRPLLIYDPLTTDANGLRQPFAGNVIPSDRISPFYRKLMEITPLPTSNVNPSFGVNFQAVYPLTADTSKISVRGDHRISDNDNLTIRFSDSKQALSQIGGRFGIPPPTLTNGYGSSRREPRVISTTIQELHTFSPRVVNEFSFNVSRDINGQGTLADSTEWANILGLPNPFNVTGWPTIESDFVIGEIGYYDADNRRNEHLTAFNIEDNVTWTAGNHSFKFGGKARSEYNNVRELQQAQGSHVFDGTWTGLYDPASDSAAPFTGLGIASEALGLPSFLSNQANRGYFYFRQKELGLYVADSWKVSRRLTLNLGLRWNYWTPYTEQRNRFINIDPEAVLAGRFQVITPENITIQQIEPINSLIQSYAARGLTYTTAEQANYPSKLVRADYNNFQPRIGAAYQLNDKTVIRGFYGEFFWPMPLSQILQSMRINPPLNLRFINDIGTFDQTSTYSLRTAPLSQFFVGQATVNTGQLAPVTLNPLSGFSLDGRNWKDDRTQSWHLSVERELPGELGLRLSYKGEHASGLEQRYSLNAQESDYNYVTRTGQALPGNRAFLRVNPNWSLSATNHTGYSNTNSGEIEIERRFSKGLAFQAFYVFSRSLNTTDAGGFDAGDANINAGGQSNAQVPSSNQIIGNQNLTYDQRLRLLYRNSGFIPQHRVRYNLVYELPFGRGKQFFGGASRMLEQVVGGWQVAAIGEWRSGNWLSTDSNLILQSDPTLSSDERLLLTRNGLPERLWFRGFFDPTLNTSGVDQSALQQLVPVDPTQRSLGTLNANGTNQVTVTLADGTTRLVNYYGGAYNPSARNFFKGPGWWNVDFTAFKNFNFTESTQLRIQADFFNVFNHPNDPDPNPTTGLQDLWRQSNDPRIIQLGLRFTW